jgi:diguanylate cyclase (GGDEF)-like protein
VNSIRGSLEERTSAPKGAKSEKEVFPDVVSGDTLFGYLEQELCEARDHGTPLSVLLMELYGSHLMNEGGGPTGDQIALEVIRMLQNDVGQRGFFGRTAGNEFLVVLKGCGRCDATIIGKRLQSKVGRLSCEGAQYQFARVSLSFGVAEFGVNGEDVDDLLRVATMETQMNTAPLLAAGTAWLSNENLAMVQTS